VVRDFVLNVPICNRSLVAPSIDPKFCLVFATFQASKLRTLGSSSLTMGIPATFPCLGKIYNCTTDSPADPDVVGIGVGNLPLSVRWINANRVSFACSRSWQLSSRPPLQRLPRF
jgi:hypothetical protein